VFYTQQRSGRGGVPFWIVKIRTMRTDAESDGVARWSGDNDPRITRVGKFLRKTRIDEIPQLWNVLRGDMSLVGPRPERPELEVGLEKELPHYEIRHLVKPGVTGWAQIHYKYGNTREDSLRKLQYDFYYIRHWSLLLDVYVVLRTVGVVFGFKGQ
jgi:lipopolysaccharide/colanic/teichoic acid biosynthesis glycosyltransferase